MNKVELARQKSKIMYRKLFYEADKIFKEQLLKLKANFDCKNCSSAPDCKGISDTLYEVLPLNCEFRKWQNACVETIENIIKPDIHAEVDKILKHKENFSCARAGICCRLACSEFSPEELKQKSLEGDEFATQFTSVFNPYKDISEARVVFPDYVDLVLETLGEDEKIHFYHCPNLQQGSNSLYTCSIYEKRPQICSEFPYNPLSILHPSCGYHQWQEQTTAEAMKLHAMTYIYRFYLEKIRKAIKND